MSEEENTAGDFTVHYNPETKCVLQTFEDGTVVDLTELFDPDVIWATYYEGRIWYSVGSIYLSLIHIFVRRIPSLEKMILTG